MQRLYLDTTVPSAYIDATAPDRQRLTEEFWLDRLPSYEPLINLINAMLGFGQIDIVSPAEL